MMRQNDNYIAFVTVEDSFYQQGGHDCYFIVGAYLVLASCCITYMFSKVMKERLEKEKLIYTSNTDELTRCLNRHAYENDMKSLILVSGIHFRSERIKTATFLWLYGRTSLYAQRQIA